VEDLISDDGKMLEFSVERLYSLLGESRDLEHRYRVLTQYQRDVSLRRRLETIQISPLIKEKSKAAVRRAVLQAHLTPLRQTIGSCFATAPAIMIQREQPHQFLRDMDSLLSAGELLRGDIAVPLSPSWDGDLLKGWEFTLASFAEAKTEFSSWNLFSSLGLQPEESGGLGL
jgi:hypothetical protein